MVGMERGEKLSERRYMEKLSTMKRRMVVAMGWLLTALLLLPMGAMAQVTTHDVKIKVTKGTTLVKDATVTIVDGSGNEYKGETPTDAEGKTVVKRVPEIKVGTVTVRVKINGKDIVVTGLVRVRKDGTVAPKAIDLAKVKAVMVTVVDAVTKKGIEGAMVTIGAQDVKTDNFGKVKLSLTIGSKFPVSVTANRYADSTVMRTVNKDNNSSNSWLDTIKLTPVRDVKITVVNGNTPVPDAMVTIVDGNGESHTTAPSTTGTDGNAIVPKVPVPTEGTVTVEKGGQVVMTAPVKVDKDGNASQNTIDLAGAKAVEVTVVDAKTKQGIKGATVAVGAQVVTTQDDAGKATLRLLGSAGTQYPVVAKLLVGYADSTVTRTVKKGNSSNLWLDTIKLTPVRDVTIKVMDNGTGVSGATVTIVDENGNSRTVKTVGDGSASLKQVPVSDSGTVTVKSGSTVVTAPVKVNRDGTAKPNTIDLKNPNIASVEMTVVDEWGGSSRVAR